MSHLTTTRLDVLAGVFIAVTFAATVVGLTVAALAHLIR